MYSQWSQYSSSSNSQSHGDGYPSYAPATQQQQQHTAITQQQGLTWNGTAWVPSQQQPSRPQSYPTTTTHPTTNATTNWVALYTQYYNEYIRLEAECHQQQRHQQPPSSWNQHSNDPSQQAAWYKHCAHQASAAAHYYHNHGNHAAPPPNLPPVPPTLAQGSTTTHVAPVHARTTTTFGYAAAHPVTSTTAAAAAPVQEEPKDVSESLKRFEHRCIVSCGQDKNKEEAMKKRIEQTIAQAFQSNTFHTIPWDQRPILTLQDETGTSGTISSTTFGGAVSQGGSQRGGRRQWDVAGEAKSGDQGGYYGPSAMGTQPELSSGGGTVGYYGPSSTDEATFGNSGTGYGAQRRSPSKKASNKRKKNMSSTAAHDSSYYGPTSSDPDDEFISLAAKKHQGASKKAKKSMFASSPDGLNKSSSVLLKRANRFSGPGGLFDSSSAPSRADENIAKYMGLVVIGGGKPKQLEEADYEQMKVKGTCTTLEKEYLRLTAPPRAELVRPQRVLKQHLQNLKNQWWKGGNNPKGRDYEWFCSQLKAIRQDLTVQQIVNDFAVDVYETHARIALEEGDLNEYNQSQTQLRELYKTLPDSSHGNEFVAYRILYYVFLTGNKKYQEGSKDLFQIMLHLTSKQRQDAKISHALRVRVAVAEYDYHAFFRLYKESPTSHGVYLMNCMIPSVRQSALYRIGRSYRPSVSIEFVLSELGFGHDEVEDGKKYLGSCGCILDGDSITTKDSVIHESDLKDKKSSLI